MQKPLVAIRADGNSQIGLGHIHRTIALAGYLTDFFSISFYVFQPEKLVIDLIQDNGFGIHEIATEDYNDPKHFINHLLKETIVVIDGYNFKTNYQQAIKDQGFKLVVIDDLNMWRNVADIVVNHGYCGKISDYKISDNTELRCGLKYAIIKKELFEVPRHITKNQTESVLICIGGTDPENYSEKIVQNLIESTNKNISLLTYPLNTKFKQLQELATKNPDRLKLHYSLNTNDLIKLIQRNDIAILQPSNIALEAATLGIYMCLVQTAENQKYIKETLISSECATEIELNNIGELIANVSIEDINNQISSQKKLFDGKAPSRFISIFNKLVLKLRKVEEVDMKLVYDWNNDPITRKNSFNKDAIKFEEHKQWFVNKIHDKSTVFFMLLYNGVPAGCVRIDNKSDENIIGITIAPEFRGKKLASPMLLIATKEYNKLFPKNNITAYIKKINEISLRSFINAGFNVVNENKYFGEQSYKLIMNLNG